MSIHIKENNKISDFVLMPGDPLRAEHIAKTYLKNVVCYNKIRGMFGFTGSYNGKKISVQASGMGIPSFSIYANELIKDFNVKTIIRVGTCGAFLKNLKIGDIILANSAHTDSNINNLRFNNINFAAAPSFKLLNKAYSNDNLAKVGSIFTSDNFYDDNAKEKVEILKKYHCLAVDMETSELYTLGAKYNIDTLAILTVSDNLETGEEASDMQRQTSFNRMIELALSLR